jgi:hypothetical protein
MYCYVLLCIVMCRFSPSLRRRGSGGGCFSLLRDLVDPLQDSIEILRNLRVGEPQHLDAEAPQVGSAFLVVSQSIDGEVRVSATPKIDYEYDYEHEHERTNWQAKRQLR